MALSDGIIRQLEDALGEEVASALASEFAHRDDAARRIDEKFDRIDERLDRIEVKLDRLEERFSDQANVLITAISRQTRSILYAMVGTVAVTTGLSTTLVRLVP